MNKKTCFKFFSSLLCFSLSMDGFALPKDHQVASGSAEFKQVDPHVLEVRPSDQSIINYSNFDIGKREKVRFIQNSKESCVLNRVQGNDPSQIFGQLESNGKVFLVNPNGIYFGPESKVNVGSFIASTLDIADTDFLQENYQFTLNNKNSEIRNEGLLESIEGSIALMAPKIQNLGTISARAGTALLASGEYVTLDFTGDGLLSFSVEGTLKEALIEQLGDISASVVQLKIPAAKKAISEIVNLDGIEEGDVFVEKKGVIKFASAASIISKKVLLEAANLEVKGTIDATSSLDKGGEVHLLGRDISLDGLLIDASGALGGGKVLIGGEYQGKGKTPWTANLTMNESSKILANALDTGDGGLVVLWSQGQTLFNGKIESRGGALSGNGGLVETSSKDALAVHTGLVDTSGPAGRYGKWLLDPYTLCIVADGAGASGSCAAASSSCDDCNTSTSCSVTASSLTSSSSDVIILAQIDVYVNTPIVMQNAGVGIAFGQCSGSSGGAVILNSGITTKGSVVDGKSQGCITFTGVFDSATPPSACNPTVTGSPVWTVVAANVILDTTAEGTTTGADITAQSIKPYISNNTITFKGGSTGTVNIASDDYAPYSIVVNSAKQVTVGVLGGSSYGSIVTSGGQIKIADSVTLIALEDISLKSSGGDISLGYINGYSSGGQSFNINAGSGAVSFNAVGDSNHGPTPSKFTVKGSTIAQNSVVLAASNVSYTGDVTTGAALTITSQAGQGIITLSGSTNYTTSLSLNANSVNAADSAINGTGSITFNCGSTGSVSSGAINISTVLSGDIASVIVKEALDIQMSSITSSGSSGNGDITFPTTSVLTLLDELTTFTAPGAITIGSIVAESSGVQGFKTEGTASVTITGSSGSTSSYLKSFQIASTGATSLNSVATLVGNINIAPAVTLGSGSTIASNGGSIVFSQAITTSGNLIIDAGVGTDGDVSIGTVSGTIDGFSASGDVVTLTNDITAGTIYFDGTTLSLNQGTTLTSTGTMDFAVTNFTEMTDLTLLNGGLCTFAPTSSPLSLTGTFAQAGAGNISLGIDISAEVISFVSPVSITRGITLTSSGTTTISMGLTGSDFGLTLANSALCTISSTSNPISLGAGSFKQTGSGSVTLASDITANSISFVSPVTFSNTATTLTASAGLTLSDSFSGACNLTLDGGFLDVTIGAGFGSPTSLQSLTVTGTDNKAYITSGGTAADSIDMSSLATIILQSSIGLTTSSGPINLGVADLDGISSGGQNLTLNSGSSATSLGPSGFNMALGAVAITASQFNSSGITTQGAAITVTGPTILRAFSRFDTTNIGASSSGADIDFSSTINTKSGNSAHGSFMYAGSGGAVSVSGNIGGSDPLDAFSIVSASNANLKSVTVNNKIDIAPHITLSDSLTTFTSNSSGDVLLGNIDGGADSAQSVTVSTGTGAIELGIIGASKVLDEVKVPAGSSATIHNITVSGLLDIDIPIFLAASTTLDTTGNSSLGSTASFKAIDGTSNGNESLTITTGTGNIVLEDNIGSTAPLKNIDMTGAVIEFEGQLVSAAGTHSYHAPVTVAESMAFRSLGDITFDSTVEPATDAPDLLIYPGSGTLTFAGSVGDAPFGNILVFNAGSVSSQDIVAKALRIAGGLPTVFLNGNITLSGIGGIGLDTGPIYFGGEINATHAWARSYGPMTALNSTQALNIAGATTRSFEYFNAVGGNIGSLSSPIELNTSHQSNLGADSRADFEGDPSHAFFLLVPSNSPCIVTFNGTEILNCNLAPTPQNQFNEVPKNLFYVTWLYSSWDNLSSPEFFLPSSIYPAEKPQDDQLIHWGATRRYLAGKQAEALGAFDKLDIIAARKIEPIEPYENVLARFHEVKKVREVKEIAATELLADEINVPSLTAIINAMEEVETEVALQTEESLFADLEILRLELGKGLSVEERVRLGLGSISDSATFIKTELLASFRVEEIELTKEEEKSKVSIQEKAKSKMILEVIKVSLLQKNPQEENVDLDFSIKFPRSSTPLDLFVDQYEKKN